VVVLILEFGWSRGLGHGGRGLSSDGWLGHRRRRIRRLGNWGRRSRGGLGPLHRAGEELEEVIEDLALVRAELAIDASDQLACAGARLVRLHVRLNRLPAKPTDQLTQPLRRSRPLFVARFLAAGVRQLVGNLREIDLEVVNKDIMHGVVLIRLQLIKAVKQNLSRAVRRMAQITRSVYKDVTGAIAIMSESRLAPGLVIPIDC